LVRWSRHEDVEAAVESGADVNEIARNLTPLDVAIHGGDIAMVDILIRAGADVNHGHPKTGKRPLHDAVTQPDLRILELLLNAGADVEGCRESSTPFCTAAAFGEKEAYDRLIVAGANPLATMHGKPASVILASTIHSDELMRARLTMETLNKTPDKNADRVKKMMAEFPTVEEYAAHRAESILIYGIDQGVFTDPLVGKWARDLGEILRSPERLEQCEERFLSGRELDRARRERVKAARRHAREQARQERLIIAGKRLITMDIDR